MINLKSSIFKFSLLLLTVLAIPSCSKDDEQIDVDSISSVKSEKSVDDAVAGAGATVAAAAAAKAPPPVLAPVLSPTQDDIVKAFEYSLMLEASKFPASPQKDAWLDSERQRLSTVRAESCTPSKVGEPSICNVIFSGNRITGLKIMLTTSGWVIL